MVQRNVTLFIIHHEKYRQYNNKSFKNNHLLLKLCLTFFQADWDEEANKTDVRTNFQSKPVDLTPKDYISGVEKCNIIHHTI